MLRIYCEDNNLELVAEIRDVASGLHMKRRGIMRLCKLVTKGKISEVIVSYRDSLTRFGFEYLEDFFISFGVKVAVIKARQSPFVQQEMVDDLIAIITSFSGIIHGLRSRRRKLEKKILIKCQPVP